MEFCKEPGRIFATDETGKLLAEVTFPEQEGIAELYVLDERFTAYYVRPGGSRLRAIPAGCRGKPGPIVTLYKRCPFSRGSALLFLP